MRGRKDKPLTNVQGSTTLIAPDVVVSGDIAFAGNLDIEGKVVGTIASTSERDALIRVVAGGKVEGEIRAPSVLINGHVVGDIHCTERLELAEQALVEGDVYYNLIEMAVGCKVNGQMRHVSPAADDLSRKREEKSAAGSD